MAGTIKGITVDIGGETTGLTKALQGVNKEASSISSELKQVEKALKLDPSNVEMLAQKQELLGKATLNAAEKVDKLREAQKQVDAQFQDGTIGEEAYRAFQRELANAESALKSTGDSVVKFSDEQNKTVSTTNKLKETISKQEGELGKLKAEYAEVVLTQGKNSSAAKELEGKYDDLNGELKDNKVKLSEAEDALKDYGDESDKAGSKLETLGGVLAGVGAAIGASVAAVSAAAGAAVGAMVDMSKGAAQYADDFATLADTTGLSSETLQGYNYAAELVDVSLDTLTGSITRQIKSMTSASQGSKNVIEAYDRLGVSIKDTNGEFRDGEKVYWEIIDALGEIENETERDSIAMQLLGKSARDLTPLINLGADALGELIEEAKGAGAVLSDDMMNSLIDVSDGMERVKSSVGAAKNNIGIIAAGALTEYYNGTAAIVQNFTRLVQTSLSGGEIGEEMTSKFTEAITETVKNVAAEIPQILSTVKTIFEGVIKAVGDAMPIVIETISTYLPELLKIISGMLPELLSTVTELLIAIVGVLISALPEILQCGVDIIMSLVDGLSEALPELIPAAVDAIIAIVKGLTGALPHIIKAALEIILALAEGLITALPELIKDIPLIINSLIDTLMKSLPLIIKTGVTLFLALVDALPEIIVGICEALPLIIDGIIIALLGSLPLLTEAGIELFVALIANAPAIITEITRQLPKIIKGIIGSILKNKSEMADAGKQLIQGLWDGISNTGKWLMDKIGGFFDGVVDGIKSFFGIKSPSALFRDEIGKSLAEGVGEGFSDEMEEVAQDMREAIPTTFDTAINAAYRHSYGDDSERTFEIITPISIGGQNLTKIVSRIQYNTQLNRARVLGVTAK